MSQIINITSEALQQTVRRLLPSQQGFGEDLQASNVILPTIDLTPTAEGSQLPGYIQTAIAFGSNTAFAAINSTVTVANTGGFYRVVGSATVDPDAGITTVAFFRLSDGLTNKTVWSLSSSSTATNQQSVSYDLTFFLRSGDSLVAVSNDGNTVLSGSVRQVATLTGELVNPVGFNPE